MSTKSSSFSELDSSSSAKVSRIPGEGDIEQFFKKNDFDGLSQWQTLSTNLLLLIQTTYIIDRYFMLKIV